MVMHALVALSLILVHLMYPPAVSSEERWVRQETPGQASLNDLDFVDRSHGWIVGSYGTLLHTADGGENWGTQQLPDTSVHLMGVDFVDVHSGWIVGESEEDNFVASTHDGGETWTRQMQELPRRDNSPHSVAFLDTQTGWVVAAWALFRTLDGGANWSREPSPTRGPWGALFGIQFVDAETGWVSGGPIGTAIGGSTYLVRTRDGGSTWEGLENRVGSSAVNILYGLDFVDREYGWVVGDTGIIWHTEDGGDTWEIQGAWGGRFADDWFLGVDFVSREEGWVVGFIDPWKARKGIILHTKDGGRHWKEETVEGESEIPGLTAVQFLDEDTGWCVGADGTVLRYLPDHPMSVETSASGNAPDTYVLFPNYPNPFNTETTIRYVLPEPVRVRLMIYDVLGRRVRTLVDEEQIAGQHSVIWDGEDGEGERVSSGVYFYCLEMDGEHRKVRRMLLLR